MASVVQLTSGQGRAVLAAAALGSGVAFLDTTVVNIAVPVIGREFDAPLGALQWTINAYTLTLASLILLGGALGDRFGRRRIFIIGGAWFALASIACALAPNIGILIAARAVQGIGGALLTPTSLAILQTVMRKEDRSRAIGAWAGLTGVSGVIGPLLGGWLLAYDWRWVFGINVPLCALTIWLAMKHVPETRDRATAPTFDVGGAALAAIALGSGTYALIAAPEEGSRRTVIVAAITAVVALMAFIAREQKARYPMVPLALFADRTFSVINLMTLGVYAGLSGVMFFLVIQLQVSLGWTPLAAGMASLPTTLLMLFFSGRSAQLAGQLGVRAPLAVGSAICAVGVGVLAMVGPGDNYLAHVLPGVTLMGIGLTVLVPTLTATVLAAAPDDLAGIASGVNNGIARAAGLFAVAALPAAAGLSGRAYSEPAMLTPAYRTALLICAGMIVVGGLAALVFLPRVELPAPDRTTDEQVTAEQEIGDESAAEHADQAGPAPCTSPSAPPTYGH